MSFTTRFNQLQNDIIARLSIIKDRPDGWLPHTVYVEEEDINGNRYNAYKLVDFKSDGSCTLQNLITGENDAERDLSEINIDWLMTVYRYYCNLSGTSESPDKMANENPLDYPLRRVLDVGLLEISCFEQSETYNLCVKALASLEEKSQPKELSVFLYPLDRFERNATDAAIIADWESDEEHDVPTRKLSPEEFAAECNDEMFADQIYWVRFIKY